MDKTEMLPSPVSPDTADTGHLRFGRGLPAPVPAEVADTGRIRFGAGVRLPASRPGA